LDNSPAAQRIGLETHPGGRIHFSGPLVFLLGFAYDVPFNSKRMTGVPDWGYKEAYVIDAAPDPGVIPAGLATTALRERVRPMLQAHVVHPLRRALGGQRTRLPDDIRQHRVLLRNLHGALDEPPRRARGGVV